MTGAQKSAITRMILDFNFQKLVLFPHLFPRFGFDTPFLWPFTYPDKCARKFRSAVF